MTADEHTNHIFTEDDLNNCWVYHKQYLIDILNGEYDVNTARENLLSLIDSEYDKRTQK